MSRAREAIPRSAPHAWKTSRRGARASRRGSLQLRPRHAQREDRLRQAGAEEAGHGEGVPGVEPVLLAPSVEVAVDERRGDAGERAQVVHLEAPRVSGSRGRAALERR